MIRHDSRAVVYVTTAVDCCPSAARHGHQFALAAVLPLGSGIEEIYRSSLVSVEQLLEEAQCRGHTLGLGAWLTAIVMCSPSTLISRAASVVGWSEVRSVTMAGSPRGAMCGPAALTACSSAARSRGMAATRT
jgi:hypothetical protein